MSRSGHLSNRSLFGALIAGGILIIAWAMAWAYLPAEFRAPGSLTLQVIGAIGAALLLIPIAFALAKRTGHAQAASAWFTAHAISAIAGSVLIVVHTAGHLNEPPALLLLVLAALTVLGVWARVHGATRMADTFGTKAGGFATPVPEVRERLRTIIDEKRTILEKLETGASESQFSPTLAHWLRAPGLTRRYAALARAEAGLTGQRRSVHPAQAWWRPLHLALAAAFLGGLLVHVVLTVFFAGWVAEGQPITWWHLSAW